MQESDLSSLVGLVGVGIKIMKDAYRNAAKLFGKKKAKALLSEAIREMLTTNPDLATAWGNILKSKKFRGEEDIEYIRATSLFRKVKAYKSVRVAAAKTVSLRKPITTLRKRNVTCLMATVPVTTFRSAKYAGFVMVSSKKEKKGTRKMRKRRNK